VVLELVESGFSVLATPGTATALSEIGVEARSVAKVGRGGPEERDTVASIESGDVHLVINTVGSDPTAVRDSASIRRTALLRGIPYFTTVAAARAGAGAIRALQAESIGVRALQEIHGLE
jgi:carbamoyl-phosphate synthase large subunit